MGMRKAGRFATAVQGALLASLAGVLPAYGAEPAPEAAPDFALKATSGQNLRLSEFRGQPVLLTFWADWCGQCRGQLDELAALAQRFTDRDVALLAVNIDSTAVPASAAAERLGVTVLRDTTRDVARAYDLADLPYTVLIDADGRIRHRYPRNRAGTARTIEADLARLVAE